MEPPLKLQAGAVGRLVFDTLILGQAQRDALSRSGIYRYASELLIALGQAEAQRHWPHAVVPFCADPLLAGFGATFCLAGCGPVHPYRRRLGSL